jgi:hypothetical protein
MSMGDDGPESGHSQRATTTKKKKKNNDDDNNDNNNNNDIAKSVAYRFGNRQQQRVLGKFFLMMSKFEK